jgi:putative transposase
MPDHVHVMAAAVPSLSPSVFVQRLKGSSSHFINEEFGIPFAWQEGYGIFSVGERGLDAAIHYVRGQKEHHAAGTTIERLERAAAEDVSPRWEKYLNRA